MTEYSSHVRFVNGTAQARFDGRSFTVADRNTQDTSLCCPIELMIGSLGS